MLIHTQRPFLWICSNKVSLGIVSVFIQDEWCWETVNEFRVKCEEIKMLTKNKYFDHSVLYCICINHESEATQHSLDISSVILALRTILCAIDIEKCVGMYRNYYREMCLFTGKPQLVRWGQDQTFIIHEKIFYTQFCYFEN